MALTAFADLQGIFADPHLRHRPTPLWWWSGEEVTLERLRWQLDQYQAGGIHSLVLINLAPAGPTYGAATDDPTWFSPRWWELVEGVCQIMETKGMKLWFYDQIGFSGANLQGAITQEHPEARGQRLKAHRREPGQPCPEAPPGQWPVAAFRGTEPVATDDPEIDLLICAEWSAFDYLSVPSFDLLLDRVHREFERRLPQYLGSVIVGSFQDELPSTNPWSADFAAEFERSCGYDLVPELCHLFGGTSERARKVRTDYYTVRTALTERAVFKPLFDWHDKYGLLLGADQSNPARSAHPIQSTQLYTDYFRTHRWINAVGSDHGGDSHAHASMARLHGHNEVWIESFHSSGWGGTLEETWDWLVPFLRSGATIYNPHASYYSTVGGWFEWAPPSTDFRQPYWPVYPQFSTAVARVAGLLTWGDFQARVAVVHPNSTVQAETPLGVPVRHFSDSYGQPSLPPEFAATDQTQDDYLRLCGDNNWFHPKPGKLDEAGIAYDIIDDDSIQRAAVADGQLSVAAQRYEVMILPGCRVLETLTAQRLWDFAESGGTLICVGDRPELAAGSTGDDELVRRLAAHPRLNQVATPAEAVALLDPTREVVFTDAPVHTRYRDGVGIAMIVGVHPMASQWHNRPDGNGSLLEFDRTRYAQRRTVTIRPQGKETVVHKVYWWNPATGSQHEVAIDQVAQDQSVTVSIDLDGVAAGLLVWEEGPSSARAVRLPPASDATEKSAPVQTVEDRWQLELIGGPDNTWGDIAFPAGQSMDQLRLWELTQGDRPVTATYGEQAVILTAAPAPLTEAEAAEVISGARALTEADTGQVIEWSTSHGARRAGRSMLGNKGDIPADFLTLPQPHAGEETSLRTVISTAHRGEAEVVVSVAAPVTAWWNGVPLTAIRDDATVRRYPVTVTGAESVLELRIQPTEHAGRTSGHWLAWLSVVLPADFPARPEYICAGEHAGENVSFVTEIEVPADVQQARLIVGTLASAVVRLDGQLIAEQARVEYYEGNADPAPSYFQHDLLATPGLLRAGEKQLLEVTLPAAEAHDVVWVDLALSTPNDTVAYVSGPDWQVRKDNQSHPVGLIRNRWRPFEACHAVRRPHPLPAGDWLLGAPTLGKQPIEFSCGLGKTSPSANDELRVLLPAGAVAVRLPTGDAVDLTIGQRSYRGPEVAFENPLSEREEAVIRFAEVTHQGQASRLRGPIEVDLVPAEISLAPWADLGLPSWSGAVAYRRRLDPQPHPWTLDLGDVRGTAEVLVDNVAVGSVFCAPFRVDMPTVAQPSELTVIVRNTLAPWYHANTSTEFAAPEQLPSGLLGPVTVHVAAHSTEV